jgi:ribosomal protein S18 acetylase RimI-like enzyme
MTAVLPEHRRKKIGTELVRRAKGEAVEKGFDRVTVNTSEENVGGRAFYLAQGFVPVPSRSDAMIKKDLRLFGMKTDAKSIEKMRKEENKGLVLDLSGNMKGPSSD